MKFNKTDIADNIAKKWSYKKFKAAFERVYLGVSLDEAWQQLGGKVPEAKAEEPKPKKEKDKDSK